MKIKTKIALRYSIVTAILMTIFATVVYLVTVHNREVEFYDNLYREGVSKANLFFEAKASPETMHSIYKNNIEYIDEVEVAIYDVSANLLYHDAKEIDIVKETPELIRRIFDDNKISKFYVDQYQAVGFLFSHNKSYYVVSAAAYDGYGYSKIHKLIINLLFLTIISIAISFILGYYFARKVLIPISNISGKMKDITANNLNLRLLGYNDNDEFGELAASFNKALDIIESSFDSQKMFVSNASHELRTPLATLVGEIDFALLKERTIEEYIDTLQNSKQDASRLIKLVNGLLDLAKTSYNENKISINRVRIDEIILDARANVIKSNPQYRIEVQFIQSGEDDDEITIQGNAYLLKIAFINLIENNCKFSENKTSTVVIFLESKTVHIHFSDTGIGINQEDIKNIFKPFYRGNNKEFTDGNGIGLALVEKVIRIHKGKIEVDSIVNMGTVFKIEILC